MGEARSEMLTNTLVRSSSRKHASFMSGADSASTLLAGCLTASLSGCLTGTLPFAAYYLYGSCACVLLCLVPAVCVN